MPTRPDLLVLWSSTRARAATATREISLVLAAVLLVGVAAAGAQAPGGAPAVQPVAQAAALPSATPPVAGRVVGSADRAVDVDGAQESSPSPSPKRAAAPAPAPAPVQRWLPSGTGMWLHDWRRSEHGSAPHVVAKSRRAGFTHLYVQTGSSKKGWIGEEVLSELLPATAGTGISVIAWDFPKLNDPEGDARRMARAATWSRPGVPRVAAVAPDVETRAEGTNITAERVTRYYAELRRLLPDHVAVLATVPWPSEKRTGSYPYGTTAPYTDAWIPMAYWYNRDPAVVTATSMTWLARYGKPIMPVGQGYDGRLDAPYLAADPAPDKSVAAFADTARAHGARSISLWSWQTTGRLQWQVLAEQSRHFVPRPAAAREAVAPAAATADDEAAGPGEDAPAEQAAKDEADEGEGERGASDRPADEQPEGGSGDAPTSGSTG